MRARLGAGRFVVCTEKVAVLDGVVDVDYFEPSDFDEELGEPAERFRKAADELSDPLVVEVSTDCFRVHFQILREGAVIALLRVEFSSEPETAVKEIISQFCRLTGNEIRRRDAEMRALEFESLVALLRKASADEVALRLPHVIKTNARLRRLFLFREGCNRWRGGAPPLVIQCSPNERARRRTIL